MKELYYPNFEIKNEKWLKYSLLYKENIHSIVPYEIESRYFSDLYNYINNETDLLHKYAPMWDEIEKTSREFIVVLENILKKPQNYFSISKTTSSRVLAEKWSNNKYYTLFSGKYSFGIEDFLLDNNLADRVFEGVKIHNDIALIFMGALSENIARKEGFTLTTDEKAYKNLSQLYNNMWDRENTIESYLGYEAKIMQKIPLRLEDISIKQIIQLRNSDGYKELLKAYNRTLNQFITNLDKGEDFKFDNYLDDLRIINTDLVGQISSLLGATIGMSMTLIGTDIGNEIIKNMGIVSGTLSMIGAGVSMQTNINQYAFADRVKVNKFINKIENIPFRRRYVY